MMLRGGGGLPTRCNTDLGSANETGFDMQIAYCASAYSTKSTRSHFSCKTHNPISQRKCAKFFLLK